MINNAIIILIIKSISAVFIIYLSQITNDQIKSDFILGTYYSSAFFMALVIPPTFLQIKRKLKIDKSVNWPVIIINLSIVLLIFNLFLNSSDIFYFFVLIFYLERISFLMNFVFLSKILSSTILPIILLFPDIKLFWISWFLDSFLVIFCILAFVLWWKNYITYLKETFKNISKVLLLMSTRSRFDGLRIYLSENFLSASDVFLLVLPVQFMMNYVDIKLSYAERNYISSDTLVVNLASFEKFFFFSGVACTFIFSLYFGLSVILAAMILVFLIIFVYENYTSLTLQYETAGASHYIRILWLLNYASTQVWVFVLSLVSMLYCAKFLVEKLR